MKRVASERSVMLDVTDLEGIAQLRMALRTATYSADQMRPMLRAGGDNHALSGRQFRGGDRVTPP